MPFLRRKLRSQLQWGTVARVEEGESPHSSSFILEHDILKLPPPLQPLALHAAVPGIDDLCSPRLSTPKSSAASVTICGDAGRTQGQGAVLGAYIAAPTSSLARNDTQTSNDDLKYARIWPVAKKDGEEFTRMFSLQAGGTVVSWRMPLVGKSLKDKSLRLRDGQIALFDDTCNNLVLHNSSFTGERLLSCSGLIVFLICTVF